MIRVDRDRARRFSPRIPAKRRSPKRSSPKLQARHVFKAPIATRTENGGFFPAEPYHQDYARKHQWEPYIVINDRPKVAAQKRQYPGIYKG